MKPDPKAQYNFTDPDSRIMHSPDGFVQAYNVQVAVDNLQLIVGQAVTQETNDKHQLLPMIATIEQEAQATPTQLLADAGYCSDENLAAFGKTTIDAYIANAEAEGRRPTGAVSARAPAEDRHAGAAHDSEAPHEGRRRRVRRPQGACRTCDRPDQTGARLSAILAARIRERPRGVVVGLHDAQHSQAASPLCLRGGGSRRPSRSGTHGTSPRPSPTAAPDSAGAQQEAS